LGLNIYVSPKSKLKLKIMILLTRFNKKIRLFVRVTGFKPY